MLLEGLHTFSYLILLLSIGLLGFSAGRLRSPLIFCKPRCSQQEDQRIAKRADQREAAEHRSGKRLGSRGRMQREEHRMNRSKDDKGLEATQGEKMQVRQEKREPINEGNGLKQRGAQSSSSRPSWLRSLSLGQRRRWESCSLQEQDSNPGPAPKSEEKGVQRKASLTGEEVKVLADAFIARVRQRMRVQRQESLKLRPEQPYEAPPLP